MNIINITDRPIVLTKDTQELICMNKELMQEVLEIYKLTCIKENGLYTYKIKELDIKATNKDTLIKNLKEYAEKYYNDMPNSYNDNKKEYPYVLRILLADNIEDLLKEDITIDIVSDH